MLYVVCALSCDYLNFLQCRALHKQLSHNAGIRNKLAQDLQSAGNDIQQLQVLGEGGAWEDEG